MATIEKIKTKNILWVNVKKAGKKEMEFLAGNFKYHNLDLRDCLPPLQRPKLFNRKAYLFITLLFPAYNPKERKIFITEVDFFVTSNQLTMVHSNDLAPLTEIFKKYSGNTKQLQKDVGGNPGALLNEILSALMQSLFPMITHIGNDIDRIENKIFSGKEKERIEEILAVKRNILNFIRAAQGHKSIITKLSQNGPDFFPCKNLNIYFKNMIAGTKDAWDLIETYKETITNLEDANNSLVSLRLNNIMKTLTIISVIVFPLTLLAAIFGMNVMRGMPFINNTNGFWTVMILMGLGILIMLLIFKRKRWI